MPSQRTSPFWQFTGQVPGQSSPSLLVSLNTHLSSSLHPYSSTTPSHRCRDSVHSRGHCWLEQMFPSWSFCLGRQSLSCLHPFGKGDDGHSFSSSSHSTGQNPSQSSLFSSNPLWTQMSFCKQPVAVCFWPHLIWSSVHSTVQIRSQLSPLASR